MPTPEEYEGMSVLQGTEFVSSGETYLRLLEVDLNEPEAILAFVNRCGILDGAWAHASALRELGAYEKALDHRREWRRINKAVMALLGGDSRDNEDAHLTLGSDQIRFIPTLSDLRAKALAGKLDNAYHRVPFIETLAEFRLAARCLHDLYWAWRVFSEGLHPHDVEWQSYPDSYPIRTLGDVSTLLTQVLPRMGRIGPQVQIASGPQPFGQRFRVWAPPHESQLELRSSPPTARLYQACAIELYNHIVEQAEYRVCANEMCGKVFVRQEGRAIHDQRRTKGVKYCTASCARAQAQRNYRYRKRRDSGESLR